MKIAVIGSGIAGMGVAHLLSARHDVTVFEKNAYAGGHSRTIEVRTGDSIIPVDTGFIVFNDWNYPNLMGLFKTLGVPYEKSDMSFGVSVDGGWLEYASGNLIAQKANILRPQFWGMVADILRFNSGARRFIGQRTDITLEECLNRMNMGEWFRKYYLLAMGAAIWSCPVETIMKFPAHTFLKFFENHGLLNIATRPQWYTVSGGSREYVRRLIAASRFDLKLGTPAKTLRKGERGWIVTDYRGQESVFDHVILACHADEALAIIDAPTPEERRTLNAFTYQENRIVVHTDPSFMPKNRNCWASWVYLNEGRSDEKPEVSLTYWMNNLQNLDPAHPVFITLNPGRMPAAETILDQHKFTHPVFDQDAVEAQGALPSLQGQRGLWFCGAYHRYGFHEDGLMSAVSIAKAFKADIPWQ